MAGDKREMRELLATSGRALAATLLCVFLALGAGCSSTPSPDLQGEAGGAYNGPRPGADLPGAPGTDAEWARYEQGLASLASFYNVDDPPPVDVVAWVKPEERSLYTHPCIREAGFQQQDGMWVGVTKEQRVAFELANYKCSAAYPTIAKYTAPLTDKHKRNAYEWTVETVIPCLESRGYTIRDVPTQEVFISRFDTDPFYPFSQIGDLSNEDWDALEAECIQWPPSDVLYAD